MGSEKQNDRQLRRGIGQIHKVLGLSAGLLVLLTCGTGILLQYPQLLGSPEVTITTYAGDTFRSERLFRGTSLGLEISEDGGRHWQEVNMLMPPGSVRRILVDAGNPDRVLVLGSDGLVVSHDGGHIWEALDLPTDDDNHWLELLDLAWASGGGLDLASDRGLLHSDDGGVTWSFQPWIGLPDTPGLRGQVHNLHTGYGMGNAWHKAVTVGAVALIFLTLTGLYLGMAKRKGKILLFLLMLGGPVSAQGQASVPPVFFHEEARFLMGTLATAAAWAPTQDYAEAAVEAALKEIDRVESLLSTWKPESELSLLNAGTANEPVQVSFDLGVVLEASLSLAEASGGAFDPTVLPLVKLWGFRSDGPVHAPSGSAVASCLEMIDYRFVSWDSVTGTVSLARPEVQLDFGGIAKGYALDRAAEIMADLGAVAGQLDLGGGILVFGEQAAQEIGIVDPSGATENLGGVVLADASLATSGQYERYRENDRRRWGHILDPRTGQPSEHLLSVTVLAESALMADAAATACFVLGASAGMKFLEGLQGCEGIIVMPGPADGPKILFTSGLADQSVNSQQ